MQLRIISCDMLEQYLKREDILIIDLRSKEDYDKGHILGAIRADWETLEDTIPSLLASVSFEPAWIILYCDHGNTSLLTARDLARNGYPVMSLNGGYSYWQSHLKSKADLNVEDLYAKM